MFLHRAARFVAEHRGNAERWDLAAIARELQGKVGFHLAGSAEDPFGPRQITAARERLARSGADIRMFPGGHLTTSEQPELLADAIHELADAHRVGQPVSHAPRSHGERHHELRGLHVHAEEIP